VVVRGKAARTDPETSNLANSSQSRYKERNFHAPAREVQSSG
jgi:hypothetical protein